MTTGFALPFTVRSTIHYETGLDHVILLCTTPIDDGHSYFTFVVWRNDDHTVPAEEVIAFDRAIGAEDRRMLERLPGVLPLEVTGHRQRAGRPGLGGVAPPPRRRAGLTSRSTAVSCTGRGSSTR